jgi:glutamine synthetase
MRHRLGADPLLRAHLTRRPCRGTRAPWALDLLESSDVAREMLGADFVPHYAAMKRFEAEKYRQQVSEWEVRRHAGMA